MRIRTSNVVAGAASLFFAAVAAVSCGGSSDDIAVLSPDATRLFVSNGRARSVAEIDVAQRSLLRTFDDVGTRPWGIGISPDGRTLFTANGPSGDLSIVDVASGKVERRIALVADAPR